MTKINDGGPAFPLTSGMAINPVTDMGGRDISSGMTLRDWFAGQIMANYHHEYPNNIDWRNVAEECYEAADAMLAERERK